MIETSYSVTMNLNRNHVIDISVDFQSRITRYNIGIIEVSLYRESNSDKSKWTNKNFKILKSKTVLPPNGNSTIIFEYFKKRKILEK